MSLNGMRTFLCWLIIVLVPFSAVAADRGAAMAHPYGAAWLNGAAVEHASVIFPGDLVQTNPNSVLKIEASGSSVTVLSDSLVKFDGTSATVERGGAKLRTATNMSARAGIVTVTPASSALTEFQVTHAAGTVQITALKGDLQISNGSQTTTLSQGQQATQSGSDKDQKMGGVGAGVAGATSTNFVIGTAKNSGAAPPARRIEPPAASRPGSPIKP